MSVLNITDRRAEVTDAISRLEKQNEELKEMLCVERNHGVQLLKTIHGLVAKLAAKKERIDGA